MYEVTVNKIEKKNLCLVCFLICVYIIEFNDANISVLRQTFNLFCDLSCTISLL